MPTPPNPIPLVCGHCGYDLGNPPLRPCPECGKDEPRAPFQRRPVGPVLIRVSIGALLSLLSVLGSQLVGFNSPTSNAWADLLLIPALLTLGFVFVDIRIWSRTDRRTLSSFPGFMTFWLGVFALQLALTVTILAVAA